MSALHLAIAASMGIYRTQLVAARRILLLVVDAPQDCAITVAYVGVLIEVHFRIYDVVQA